MQAVLLPLYKVPPHEPGGKRPDWNQPHLSQLKNEIMISSVFMLVCPFATFFVVQSNQYLQENYGWDKTNAIAALAAVGAVQFVIFVIIIVKYWEDFLICVRGEGHIPYDPSRQEESKYFQSDQYWKDVKKDEDKKKKRKKIIDKALKKTEEQSRPLFVGYFMGDQKEAESDVDSSEEESKVQEKKSTAATSRSLKGPNPTDKSAKTQDDVVVQKKGRKKKRGNFKQH